MHIHYIHTQPRALTCTSVCIYTQAAQTPKCYSCQVTINSPLYHNLGGRWLYTQKEDPSLTATHLLPHERGSHPHAASDIHTGRRSPGAASAPAHPLKTRVPLPRPEPADPKRHPPPGLREEAPSGGARTQLATPPPGAAPAPGSQAPTSSERSSLRQVSASGDERERHSAAR